MNFKRLLFSIAVVISTYGLRAQSDDLSNEWHATIKVVDESGVPVGGADVAAGYFVAPPPGESIAKESIDGLTDSNGLFIASHRDRSITLGFRAHKEGYYVTHVDYPLGMPNEYNVAKWNPSFTLVLKKITEPIPMYAKKILGGPPVQNQPVGYDLMAGDWVAPQGKGQHSDIIFTQTLSGKPPYDYELKLTVSFPNPGDGIQEFNVPQGLNPGSGLKSPRLAPLNGYQAQIVREARNHPGEEAKHSDYNENRNYFFRVQTFLDQNGNVKSPLYGKIYGDFVQFSYYLNPTPNSRNMEFDPKQNLLKRLKSFEQVNYP